jgi:hypothetical protein
MITFHQFAIGKPNEYSNKPSTTFICLFYPYGGVKVKSLAAGCVSHRL